MTLLRPLLAAAMTGCLALTAFGALKADYNTVPKPEIALTKGAEGYTLHPGTLIAVDSNSEAMIRNAGYLADYLERALGAKSHTVTGRADGAILLSVNESLAPEAYRLTVGSDGITIEGGDPAGVFYGIQQLRKSLPIAPGQEVQCDAAVVQATARFGYRGAHFDTSRHFFTLDQLKTYIDMMALHGMNRFHWHITDDQGWRLEIKSHPRLAQEGSKRSQTVIGRNSGQFDGIPYGGYYTQEEARELVKYAADRYITVIPEIDLPGHMQAALKVYPQLGCTGGPYETWTIWGVSDDVLCAGNDDTLRFLEDVYSELIDIFPSELIHVGGDECPKTRWKECPKCQAKIAELGISADGRHTAEEYLQSYVIRHMEQYLNARGRQIIGWDEILEGGLAPNAAVMSWRGIEGGIEAARQGHDVVMVPTSYLYLDYYQSRDFDNEPLSIGGYVPVERVYSYEPMPEQLTPDEQKHIIGVQANLWTEYVKDFPHAQYMVLPRWAALCEVQWMAPDRKDYDDFLHRLPRLADWYDAEGYNYAKHVLPGR